MHCLSGWVKTGMTNNTGTIDAKTSVEGMISVIEGHSPSELNGRWCARTATAVALWWSGCWHCLAAGRSSLMLSKRVTGSMQV